MLLIVKTSDSSSQTLDTSSRSIFTTIHADINILGASKTPLDVILDFGSALPQVGPTLWIIEVTSFICPFGSPDDTG
jgi:hypothetical protein